MDNVYTLMGLSIAVGVVLGFILYQKWVQKKVNEGKLPKFMEDMGFKLPNKEKKGGTE